MIAHISGLGSRLKHFVPLFILTALLSGCSAAATGSNLKVLYGTDRSVTCDGAEIVGFGNHRSKADHGNPPPASCPEDGKRISEPLVAYGVCNSRPDESAKLLTGDALDQSQTGHPLRDRGRFKQQLERALDEGGKRAQGILLFVHGFNVGFADACREAGEIVKEWGFDGVPVIWSWPSKRLNRLERGLLAIPFVNVLALGVAYLHDETDNEWSVPRFRDFLRDVIATAGTKRVHIAAHSMGNRLLRMALLRLLARGEHRELADKLRSLTFFAPDVDYDVFADAAGELVREVCQPPCEATLYVSEKDQALTASRGVHINHFRAGHFHWFQENVGDRKSPLVAAGLNTVDATLVDKPGLGHSYYRELGFELCPTLYLGDTDEKKRHCGTAEPKWRRLKIGLEPPRYFLKLCPTGDNQWVVQPVEPAEKCPERPDTR